MIADGVVWINKFAIMVDKRQGRTIGICRKCGNPLLMLDIKAVETGFYYCSVECAREDVAEEMKMREEAEERNRGRVTHRWEEEGDFPYIEELQAEQAADEEADREDYEKQVREAVEEGEFSEATIRAIKAGEDERQKRLLVVEGK